MTRFAIALLLSVLVPFQVGAVACAQICGAGTEQSAASVSVAHDEGGGASHEHHCDKTESPGKCCQGHSVMAFWNVPVSAVAVPAFERAFFVARWTNFIPEEPSPPPIG